MNSILSLFGLQRAFIITKVFVLWLMVGDFLLGLAGIPKENRQRSSSSGTGLFRKTNGGMVI